MRVLFSSYGNDSIALIAYAHEKRMTGTVAFSDTGWAAPWWMDRVAKGEAWAQSLGFETTRIQSEGMTALVHRKKAWPRGGGGTFQFCTHNLKQAPAIAWLEQIDHDGDALCMVAIRRDESPNRLQFPEWTEVSEKHGGRSLWAPLVRMTQQERDEVIRSQTPFDVLPYRSKECYPCVNAGKRELRMLDPETITKVAALESVMGVNSKGNERVMFSPKRHGGAIGIHAVVADARSDNTELFATTTCDGGWCEGEIVGDAAASDPKCVNAQDLRIMGGYDDVSHETPDASM